MLTVEQAKEKILANVKVSAEEEEVVTLYCAGRILAQDVVATLKVPSMDNSQMDGYAVRVEDF